MHSEEEQNHSCASLGQMYLFIHKGKLFSLPPSHACSLHRYLLEALRVR